jgi:hypothetical protein
MKATIELVIDDRGALIGARGVDRALDSLGATADKSAKRFDAAFGSALRSAEGKVRGFVTGTVQSFLGNALANAASKLASATSDAFKGSLDAAKEAADAQRFLTTSSKLTGTALQENVAVAERLREQFGLTRADAQGLVAQALAFTSAAGQVGKTADFVRALGDSAVGSGRSLTELREILGQLSAGSDEATEKLFGGRQPSQIYEQFAKTLGTTGEKLDATQKKQALLNETITHGARVAGSAADRLKDYGGQVDSISALFTDLEAAAGKFILSNEGIQGVVGGLADGLKNANQEGSAFKTTMAEVGPVLGEAAQAAVLVGGRLAEGFARAQFGVGMVIRGLELLDAFFDKVAANFELSMLKAVQSVVEGARSALPESVADFVGLRDPGPGVGADIARREAELAGIEERGRNLVRSADEFEREQEARIAAIRSATDAGVERAAAFGRFGASSSDPTFRAKGIDFTKHAVNGLIESVEDGVPSLASATKATQAFAAATESVAEASERATRDLAKVQREDDVLRRRIRGLPAEDADTKARDIRRLFDNLDGLVVDAFGQFRGDGGISGPDAQKALLDAARAGEIDFTALTGGQKSLLLDLVDADGKRRADQRLEEARKQGAAAITGKTPAQTLAESVADGVATLTSAAKDAKDAAKANAENSKKLSEENEKLRAEFARVTSGGVVATVIAKAEQGTSISSFAQAGDGQRYGALPAQPAR